jgi:acyl-CoA synthetase (AMP-forming)/AMP-acid ligase II/acyl carrier protein
MKNNRLTKQIPLTIYDQIYSSCIQNSKSNALTIPNGRSYSYQDLLIRINKIAKYLIQCGLNLNQSNRVAIVMPNNAEMSLALIGVTSVATAVPLNPKFTKDEYLVYFKQSKANYLFIETDISGAKDAALELGIIVIRYEDINQSSFLDDQDFIPKINPKNLAILLLTSGSTGSSKLVPLSHENICSSAIDVINSIGLSIEDRCLSMWEQYHIGGVVDLLLAPLISGGEIISAGSFNAISFFDLLSRYKPTWFQGVPTSLRELCFVIKKNKYDSKKTNLRFIRCVAAALPESLLEELQQLFNVSIIRTYGMTEASPLITSTDFMTSTQKTKTVGKPCGPIVEIHDSDGNIILGNAIGLIAISGKNVFEGYEGDDESNRQVFKNGWFYTGDMGYFDNDGDLFITGRVKEIINRGGEKISPKEVDDAITKHPEVIEAATFSLPHPSLGEQVASAVVLKEGSKLSEVELKLHLNKLLADFKVPTKILFISELPRSSLGKIRRGELVDLVNNYHDLKKIVPPSNSLEKILQLIWMEELDLDQISTEDDFSDLGGDSLSSTRILISIQRLFGINIPDSHIKYYTSIRKMAEGLIEIGITLELAQRLYETELLNCNFSKKVNKAHTIDLISKRVANFDSISQSILYECKSFFEFETYRHAIENIATPSEINIFLTSKPKPLSHIKYLIRNKVGIKTIFKIYKSRKIMRIEFNKTLRYACDAISWYRKEITQNIDIFTNGDNKYKNKILIVGFSSRSMRLTAPTYQILSCLNPKNMDLIIVRDSNRNHFKYGISSIHNRIEEIPKWFNIYLEDKNYKKIVALGTSSGALVSIYTAIINQWDRVLACGPDKLKNHDHLTKVFEGIRKKYQDNKIVCAYSARNIRDSEGAAELKNLMPNIKLIADERFDEHALLYQLQLIGELKSFLLKNLNLVKNEK